MDAGPNIWSVVCRGPLHGFLMEETTCRCAGLLQMYWLNSHGQSTRDGSPIYGFLYRPKNPHHPTVMKYYEILCHVPDCDGFL